MNVFSTNATTESTTIISTTTTTAQASSRTSTTATSDDSASNQHELFRTVRQTPKAKSIIKRQSVEETSQTSRLNNASGKFPGFRRASTCCEGNCRSRASKRPVTASTRWQFRATTKSEVLFQGQLEEVCEQIFKGILEVSLSFLQFLPF